MSKAKRDIEELKTMQKKASERRTERKVRRASTKPVAEPEPTAAEEREIAEVSEANSSEQSRLSDLERNLEDLATDLKGSVKEMEAAAREHPGVVLLAAFASGIVVGHVLGRK